MKSNSKLTGTLLLLSLVVVGLVACSQQVDDVGVVRSEEALSTQLRIAPGARGLLESVGIGSPTEGQLKKLDTDKSTTTSLDEVTAWLYALRSSNCPSPTNCNGGGGDPNGGGDNCDG